MDSQSAGPKLATRAVCLRNRGLSLVEMVERISSVDHSRFERYTEKIRSGRVIRVTKQ